MEMSGCVQITQHESKIKPYITLIKEQTINQNTFLNYEVADIQIHRLYKLNSESHLINKTRNNI
jgi:hypothetical protein